MIVAIRELCGEISLPPPPPPFLASEGCEVLSEVLASNTSLHKIILSGNLLDDNAIKAIADGLSRNKSLTTLVSTYNDPVGLMRVILLNNSQAMFVDELVYNISRSLLHLLIDSSLSACPCSLLPVIISPRLGFDI